MKVEYRSGLEGVEPKLVVACLHETSGWGRWMKGVGIVEWLYQGDRNGDVRLLVAGPRTLRIDVGVTFIDKGFTFALLEGPLSVLNGSVSVEAPEIRWQIDLRALTSVPVALRNELRDFILPSWTRALLEEALV